MRIVRISGKDEKLLQRLRELGLVREGNIEVISRDPNGGTIVLVKGTRLALDREISRSIFVA